MKSSRYLSKSKKQPSSSASIDPDVEIIDMYKNMPKKYLKELPTYPTFNKIQLQLPMRVGVIGPSGTKKTQWALNTIRVIGAWDRIYLFAKDLEEPLYKQFIDQIQAMEKKMYKSRELDKSDKILYFSNDITELPPIDSLDKKLSNLVLIDDMITEKNLKNVSEYFIRARKQNCSVMFLSQSYFQIPKVIRSNMDILVILRINTMRDLNLICSEYSLGVDKKELQSIYKFCLKENNPNFFFLIDMANSNPDLRFRCGWRGIKLYDSDEDDLDDDY